MIAKAESVEPPGIADLVLGQRQNAFFDQIKPLAGTPNCRFKFDKNRSLVRRVPLDGPISWLVPINLHYTILYLAHHST